MGKSCGEQQKAGDAWFRNDADAVEAKVDGLSRIHGIQRQGDLDILNATKNGIKSRLPNPRSPIGLE